MAERQIGLQSPTGQDKDTWVAMQKKTFTKWVNNHLRKKGAEQIKDVQTEFDTGIKLMEIIHALYDIPMPKYNKAPKMRPHKLDNIELALKMVETEAKIKTNFLKPIHLVDHDLKMILGMIWSVILDYAIKGITVDDMNAKEGLLLWVRKKTAGYRGVDPPSVQNFSTHWRNGLAFCALIHRHQPAMLDYSKLDAKNAKENLELAFSTAEKLGIPRLLDVEDCMTERPDDKAIMTQVAEYFHRFATQDIKELHARRAAKFAAFARKMNNLKHDYESRARALLSWCEDKTNGFSSAQFGDKLEDVVTVFDSLKEFLVTEKPPKSAEKLDIEALFAEIQTELKVNDRQPYEPSSEITIEAVENAWNALQEAEKAHAVAVRENRFKFVQKEEVTLSEEKLKEFKESFEHFDVDKDNTLNKQEFKAACQTMSVPFKDEAHMEKTFTEVSEGNKSISVEQFTKYMRALQEDRDSPEQLKQAFTFLSNDSKYITADQLQVPPLSDEDVKFLLAEMPSKGADGYDYSSYVDKSFLSSS